VGERRGEGGRGEGGRGGGDGTRVRSVICLMNARTALNLQMMLRESGGVEEWGQGPTHWPRRSLLYASWMRTLEGYAS
jgi:hypothetical protein